jgi:hypothetical protein
VEEALVRAVMDYDSEERRNGTGESVGSGQMQNHTTTLSTLAVQDGMMPRTPSAGPVEPPPPAVEKLTREKRVLLTASEEREIERLVARVAEEVTTPVKLSHMLRAFMTLLLHAETEITKRARQMAPLHRPPNGDPLALARFEQRLAQILSAAFRDAPPLR